MIRPVTQADAAQICAIYNHYIATSVISFEQTAVSVDEMEQRIAQIEKLGLPWLVAIENECVLGYAYATTWKARIAYRFSVEITIYLAQNGIAKGIGTRLYQALFEVLEARDVHAVVACIALPNPQSVALHEKFGMRKVGHFVEVGHKFGRWLDVGYWQVNLPRTTDQSGGSQ
jgi:L-amino acid N-acyltransferase YncA